MLNFFRNKGSHILIDRLILSGRLFSIGANNLYRIMGDINVTESLKLAV